MAYRINFRMNATVWALTLILAPLHAHADAYIGVNQGGAPGWSLETFPVFTHTGPNSNSISTFSNPAYFTETGFTGTHRDQLEFWMGTFTGYANTNGIPGASGFGVSYPEVGVAYYYNVVVPDQPVGSPGYKTFWTDPALTVNFPNGSSKNAGFGAGANQFSYGFSVANYVQIGRIGVTVNPVELTYASANLNSTDVGNGQMEKLRGGLSVTFADIAAGYQVRDDLYLGVHHAYSIYSWKGSDFAEAREGKIGPTFSYLGWARLGLYVSGNLDFDYYTSSNMKKSVSVTMSIIKQL